MGKSQGNALPLSAAPDEIRDGVRRMYTDPGHLKASDPGRIEGNVVFTYLDAFDEDRHAVEELKARYTGGGLGDSVANKGLEEILQALLEPIRERREALARDAGYVLEVVRRGTAKARDITDATLCEVRAALGRSWPAAVRKAPRRPRSSNSSSGKERVLPASTSICAIRRRTAAMPGSVSGRTATPGIICATPGIICGVPWQPVPSFRHRGFPQCSESVSFLRCLRRGEPSRNSSGADPGCVKTLGLL
jgi:hypothetical protein